MRSVSRLLDSGASTANTSVAYQRTKASAWMASSTPIGELKLVWYAEVLSRSDPDRDGWTGFVVNADNEDGIGTIGLVH